MVSILRSFSQRFNKKRAPKPEEVIEKSHGISKPEINSRKQFLCKVILLDGTDLNIALSRKAVGQEAYDKVFNHLDLDESDYFGLQYTDHYNVQHWLDPWKKIRKQISIGRICTFRFQVKFFSSEPSNLRSEFTKYQFFLQLKNDIRTGKLKCPKSAVIPMAALQLQSECGDYNHDTHHAAFVSEFRFHPEQDEEMEISILEEWTRLIGRSPAEAEHFYLDHAKRLEFYGVELYEVLAKDDNNYMLGLTPSGVIVLDKSTLIGLLFWHFILQFSFHNRFITIVLEEHISEEIQQHTFVFELESQKAAKQLWKRAVEYHTFYRMKRHRPHRKAAEQILKFRSTFEHRGRTEFENVNNPLIRRDQRSISFQRKPSQRYGPRQSHIQRLREEREKKNQEARQRQLENAEQDNNNVHMNVEDKQLSDVESRNSQQSSHILGSVQNAQEDVKQQPELFGKSSPFLSKSSLIPSVDSSTSFDAIPTTVSMVEVRDENDCRNNVNIMPRVGLAACSRIPRYGKPSLPLYEEPADALPEPMETPKSRYTQINKPIYRPKPGYPKIHSSDLNNHNTTSFGVEVGKNPRYPTRAVVMTQL